MSHIPLDRPADVAALRRRAAEMPAHPAPPTREERLRLDPLPFIPETRLAAARAPAPEPEAGPFHLMPDDPAFIGRGWWPADMTPMGAVRWAGAGPCAAVLLPALGGGALRLTLALRSPFSLPLGLEPGEVLLDGVPLAFGTLENDGLVGRFAAAVTLPPMPAMARLGLLVQAPLHEDPAGRETRRLGVGLMWLRLERA